MRNTDIICTQECVRWERHAIIEFWQSEADLCFEEDKFCRLCVSTTPVLAEQAACMTLCSLLKTSSVKGLNHGAGDMTFT